MREEYTFAILIDISRCSVKSARDRNRQPGFSIETESIAEGVIRDVGKRVRNLCCPIVSEIRKVMKTSKSSKKKKLIISGFITGWISAMFASGGGPIFSWLMQGWCEYDIKHVNGPALVTLSAVASVGFALRLALEKTDVKLPIAMIALVSGIPGVLLGKKLALWLSSARLRQFFAVFLILAGVRMIGINIFPAHVLSGTGYVSVVGFGGFIAGFGSSLLGMGGGLILVPIFTIYAGLSANEALATSLLASIPMMMLGAILYFKTHHINLDDLRYIVPLAVVGALLGAYISHSIPNRPLQVLFGIFLIFSALKAFLDTRVTFRLPTLAPEEIPLVE